jgi:hypothetical protein
MGHLTVHIAQTLNTDSFIALISPPRKIQTGIFTKSLNKKQDMMQLEIMLRKNKIEIFLWH